MKLTVIRLQQLSAQDRLDLAKIWPDENLEALAQRLDEQHQLYAAKFNDRLLAAVKVTFNGTGAELQDLRVRDVTRRRGVGAWLLEEVLAQNPAAAQWWMADKNVEDRAVMGAFMQHAGFIAQVGGWGFTRSAIA